MTAGRSTRRPFSIILKSKKINDNFSYDVERYMNFKNGGSNFEIYDLESGKYISG